MVIVPNNWLPGESKYENVLYLLGLKLKVVNFLWCNEGFAELCNEISEFSNFGNAKSFIFRILHFWRTEIIRNNSNERIFNSNAIRESLQRKAFPVASEPLRTAVANAMNSRREDDNDAVRNDRERHKCMLISTGYTAVRCVTPWVFRLIDIELCSHCRIGPETELGGRGETL